MVDYNIIAKLLTVLFWLVFLLDEIIMHESVTTVYRSNVDLFFCVLGAQNENEVSEGDCGK